MIDVFFIKEALLLFQEQYIELIQSFEKKPASAFQQAHTHKK
jgi:hypothetical protein